MADPITLYQLLFGRKLVRRKRGLVADRCPVCWATRAFGLRRIGDARTVIGVPVGAGPLVRWEIECKECGLIMDVRRDRFLEPMREKSEPELRALIAASNPELVDRPGPEEVSSELGRSEREVRLRNALHLIDWMFERRNAESPHQLSILQLTLAVGLFALLLWIIWLLLGELASGDKPVAIGVIILFCAALAFAVGFAAYRMLMGRRIYVRKTLEPLLARAWAPLRPKAAEVDYVLRDGPELARHMDPKRIHDLMRDA